MLCNWIWHLIGQIRSCDSPLDQLAYMLQPQFTRNSCFTGVPSYFQRVQSPTSSMSLDQTWNWDFPIKNERIFNAVHTFLFQNQGTEEHDMTSISAVAGKRDDDMPVRTGCVGTSGNLNTVPWPIGHIGCNIYTCAGISVMWANMPTKQQCATSQWHSYCGSRCIFKDTDIALLLRQPLLSNAVTFSVGYMTAAPHKFKTIKGDIITPHESMVSVSVEETFTDSKN